MAQLYQWFSYTSGSASPILQLTNQPTNQPTNHNEHHTAQSFLKSQEFSTFYGTPRFIAVFTTARHFSLSRVMVIQSTPCHPVSFRLILILSYLCPIFQLVVSFIHEVSPAKPTRTSLSSPNPNTCHTPSPSHPLHCTSCSSSLHTFLQFPSVAPCQSRISPPRSTPTPPRHHTTDQYRK